MLYELSATNVIFHQWTSKGWLSFWIFFVFKVTIDFTTANTAKSFTPTFPDVATMYTKSIGVLSVIYATDEI